MAAELIPPTAKVVDHSISAKFYEVIPAAMAQEVERATIDAAGSKTIATDAELAKANELATRLHTLESRMHDRSEEVRKPLKALRDAVDGIISKYGAPLSNAKKEVKAAIVSYTRKRDALAEKVAAEENAKRDAAIREVEEKHKAAVAEAQRKADDEAREFAEAMGETYVPAAKPVEVAMPAETQARLETLRAPVATVAPKVESAVKVRKGPPKVVIDDARKVARAFADGIAKDFCLMEPCMAEIKRALQAGLEVPGAHLEETEQHVTVNQ